MPKPAPPPPPDAGAVVVAVIECLRRDLELERRKRIWAERELERLTAWIAERLPAPPSTR